MNQRDFSPIAIQSKWTCAQGLQLTSRHLHPARVWLWPGLLPQMSSKTVGLSCLRFRPLPPFLFHQSWSCSPSTPTPLVRPIMCCLTAHPGFRPLLRNSHHFTFQQRFLRKPTSCWATPFIFPPLTSHLISEVTSFSMLGKDSLRPLFFYCFFSHLLHTVLPGPLQVHSPWHMENFAFPDPTQSSEPLRIRAFQEFPPGLSRKCSVTLDTF